MEALEGPYCAHGLHLLRVFDPLPGRGNMKNEPSQIIVLYSSIWSFKLYLLLLIVKSCNDIIHCLRFCLLTFLKLIYCNPLGFLNSVRKPVDSLIMKISNVKSWNTSLFVSILIRKEKLKFKEKASCLISMCCWYALILNFYLLSHLLKCLLCCRSDQDWKGCWQFELHLVMENPDH